MFKISDGSCPLTLFELIILSKKEILSRVS